MAAASLTHLSPTLQIPSADISSTDDERLIREGEAAVEGYILDLDSARRQILPMARGLCAARRLYPATQAFGGWLQGSPYQSIGRLIAQRSSRLARTRNSPANSSASFLWSRPGRSGTRLKRRRVPRSRDSGDRGTLPPRQDRPPKVPLKTPEPYRHPSSHLFPPRHPPLALPPILG